MSYPTIYASWSGCWSIRPGQAMIHQAARCTIRALKPWWMLLRDDSTGEVTASLAILTKVIDHAGQRFRASGLSTVVVRTDQRGRGHGHQLVAAARELMARNGTDVGLFTCDRTLLHFYESAGWQHLPGVVLEGGTLAEPFPSDQPGFDKVTLGDFFSNSARLHRDDFVEARIALYPGTIARLW